MYKQFRSGVSTASDVTDAVVTRSLSNLSVNDLKPNHVKETADPCEGDTQGDSGDDVDPALQQAVHKCWETVQAQCEQGPTQSRTSFYTRAGWQTVRVFVSSTFTDFYCEREVLVKKVFPELREWCRARQLYLIECDMRWGVPKDSTTVDTIQACLEEIDKAKQETDGQPFFLTLVGEKYGWIPSFDSLSQSLIDKYSWVPDTSITFMEVIHGAYRTKNPNAVFMLRDSEVLKDVPKHLLPRYCETDSLGVQQLQFFKKMLPSRFPDQVVPYTCTVDGSITRHGKECPNIVDLDQFCSSVLEFFKAAISKCYTNRDGNRKPSYLLSIEEETASQRLIIEECAASLIGRQKEAELLWSFIQGDTEEFSLRDSSSKPFVRDPAYWGEELCNGAAPLCLCSPQGQGKTTLMASLTIRALQSDLEVFYHFCGSTGSSYNVLMLLRRLVAFLSQDFSKDNLEALHGMGEDQLRDRIKAELLVLNRGDNQRKIVIILDGMNQLFTSDSTVKHLFWLAPGFPGNVRCVISTAKHPSTESRITEHPHYLLTLEPLTRSDAKDITLSMLDKFGKKLDGDQLDVVLASACSSNPLWLYLVCEELRVYGDFRTLTSHMTSVTASIESMLQAIMSRLITDDDTGHMEQTLCILACNHGTLTTQDVQRMLGNLDTKETLPAVTWARIRRSLQTFLRIANYNDQIVFIHNMLKQAVFDSLIKSRVQSIQCHTRIADYLQHWCEDSSRRLEDLPYHLQQAGLKHRMVEFVRSMPESRFLPTFMRSRYLADCRCRSLADPVIGKVSPVLICTFCKMSRAVFHPQPFHFNKDMCVVCGSQVVPSPFSCDAYLCPFDTPSGGVGPARCYLCGKIADKKMAVPGKLCQNCGFGNAGKQCVALKVR